MYYVYYSPYNIVYIQAKTDWHSNRRDIDKETGVKVCEDEEKGEEEEGKGELVKGKRKWGRSTTWGEKRNIPEE